MASRCLHVLPWHLSLLQLSSEEETRKEQGLTSGDCPKTPGERIQPVATSWQDALEDDFQDCKEEVSEAASLSHASAARRVHLEQAMAADGRVAELAAQKRVEMDEPSRG